jgi:hypothetical protein
MQEIPRENLVPGKEYYLQNFEKTHLPPKKPYKMIAKFERLTPCATFKNYFNWACFTNFRNIKHGPDPTYIRDVVLNDNWRFYEIPRDKVQKNMETRAYNMVLLDLIKDEYFKPIGVI